MYYLHGDSNSKCVCVVCGCVCVGDSLIFLTHIRHSFGYQRQGITYLPTLAMRVCLHAVASKHIWWWRNNMHCVVCSRPRGTSCSACGAAVCCNHRIMGGEKPRSLGKSSRRG